ncbi:MAG: hypothetical protein F8N37_23825 [Telmatospirillum sp.]|nr:hypothetical protein [Telmatospirillum sp.]
MLTVNPSQTPAEVAVVVQTILRPGLEKAVRSVFSQDFAGRIHLLVGVDTHQGGTALLDRLAADCPARISMTILDPGYSTSRRHGGIYPNAYGGSLRTILSFLANSRLVAYLDDNDWYGADHLSTLVAAIKGRDWAWSGRWLVHPDGSLPICRDEWDSVGTRAGINSGRYGGFVQPSGLMLDKEACHFILPLWSLAAFPDGSGEDRLVFDELHKTLAGAATDRFTCYCTLSDHELGGAHHQTEFAARGLSWVNDPALVARMTGLLAEARAAAGKMDWAAVEASAQSLLSIHPQHAEALFLQGRSRFASGRKGEAIRSLAEACAIDDTHPDWQEAWAAALEDSRRRNEARRIRTGLARRFPGR